MAPDKIYYNISAATHPVRIDISDGWRQGMAVVLAGVYLAASAYCRPSGQTASKQADMQYTP
ncbi:hypothetical protein ABEX25_00760 [Paenibacillus thiaminolyticus]|uniref:hypothetical protein n=1 Tax=Paenibacillus thiaminolyticus TaxID=49283 RepID=UPI003D2CAA92